MSEKTVQYGPFTPQELDSFVRELQLKNIPFEIQKDEDAEKKFKAVDFSNVVNQVEFRNEQYLAQIFYVTLAKKDLSRVADRLAQLGFPTDLPDFPKELDSDDREDVMVRARADKNKFNRRMLAWFLFIGLLCSIFLGYAISVLSQP
ncbi:hypothetical protein [Bdellovibrio sp. HCB337]|uniref:hypothetical protein n=1 Tax=Bdellovibrio sp. HCB337 TaxID=3394358 RepID=UPI0039A5ED50